MARKLLVSVAIVVLAGCGGGGGQATEGPNPGGGRAGESGGGSESAAASTTKAERFAGAIREAVSRHPDGLPFEVELEQHAGREVLEVELIEGDAVEDVYFDPASGAFLSEEPETPEPHEAAGLAQVRSEISSGSVSLARAVDTIATQYPDATLREVELEVHDGRVVVEIGVTGGDVSEYVHDPASGEVIGRETAADEAAEGEEE